MDCSRPATQLSPPSNQSGTSSTSCSPVWSPPTPPDHTRCQSVCSMPCIPWGDPDHLLHLGYFVATTFARCHSKPTYIFCGPLITRLACHFEIDFEGLNNATKHDGSSPLSKDVLHNALLLASTKAGEWVDGFSMPPVVDEDAEDDDYYTKEEDSADDDDDDDGGAMDIDEPEPPHLLPR
ncbi:unnamed protein product [Linum trigynum]|uniref:Uncharacterized protein n=1 Tax=Linum trigynum TaxID=586398 RepID=A0AAV2FUJ0_9ROSI